MPGIWKRFSQSAGIFTSYVAASVLALGGLLLIYYLISQRKGLFSFIWLIIIGSVYAWALASLQLPVERIHFIEYGVLAFLVFKALRHNIQKKSLYIASAALVFALGVLDEGIQYLLPSRVYDTRDVLVNGLAGVLALLLIGLCVQPKLQT